MNKSFAGMDALSEESSGFGDVCAPTKGDCSSRTSVSPGESLDRIVERFRRYGPESLIDDELLSMMISPIVAHHDSNAVAYALIDCFGSLGAVLGADPSRYKEAFSSPDDDLAEHDSRHIREHMGIAKEFFLRVAREGVADRPVVSSWTALIEYLDLAMGHETTEHFRILFLDRKNILIKDEVQSHGTVDHTPLYPREVVKRALELGASAIIMVHNHPSGDTTPSQADIDMTCRVVAALEPIDVTVHDHVIIGKGRSSSFKTMNLI